MPESSALKLVEGHLDDQFGAQRHRLNGICLRKPGPRSVERHRFAIGVAQHQGIQFIDQLVAHHVRKGPDTAHRNQRSRLVVQAQQQ